MTTETSDLSFTVREKIARPIGEVFQAIVDPAVSCRFFMASSTGPLVAGRTVTWSWAAPTAPPVEVHVLEVAPEWKIVFRWRAFKVDYETTVTMAFEPLSDGRTAVTISESGWRNDEAERLSAFDHCSGWTHMLQCLKAWLVHGIELRA